jgi:hypothetical protein
MEHLIIYGTSSEGSCYRNQVFHKGAIFRFMGILNYGSLNMTKRDFELIAYILNNFEFGRKKDRENLANIFAEKIAKRYPAFDTAQFLKFCLDMRD